MKISLIKYMKLVVVVNFFLEIVFINVEAGLLLNIPRHDDEKAKSPYCSSSQ